MPLQPRYDYAAGFRRSLPANDIDREGSSPSPTAARVRAAVQPRSVRFELVDVLRSVQSLVPHVRLPVLLAGPRTSDSAVPSRLCQSCFPPSSCCSQLRDAKKCEFGLVNGPLVAESHSCGPRRRREAELCVSRGLSAGQFGEHRRGSAGPVIVVRAPEVPLAPLCRASSSSKVFSGCAVTHPVPPRTLGRRWASPVERIRARVLRGEPLVLCSLLFGQHNA